MWGGEQQKERGRERTENGAMDKHRERKNDCKVARANGEQNEGEKEYERTDSDRWMDQKVHWYSPSSLSGFLSLLYKPLHPRLKHLQQTSNKQGLGLIYELIFLVGKKLKLKTSMPSSLIYTSAYVRRGTSAVAHTCALNCISKTLEGGEVSVPKRWVFSCTSCWSWT